MKIAIIEDEKLAAESLAKSISKIEPSAEIVAILSSLKQAVSWISDHRADLYFMDIELGDGQSFEIFNQVNVPSPVIFTTAYDQYAIRAFKANGIEYLLKPVDETELRMALNKYHDLVGRNEVFRDLVSALQQKKEYKQRFMIQAGSRIRSIPVNEIAYFYFVEKSTFLCTHDNHHYPAEYSLDRLEEMLDPNEFYRINRQIILSIKSIRKIVTLSRSRIKLELMPPFHEEVLVSFNRAPDFREWLDK